MEHRQLTWRQRGELWLRLGIRFVLAGAAVWLAAGLGRRLLYLFAPFLFALAAAALLNPGGRRLQRMLGWSRSALTLIVLLLLLGAAGAVEAIFTAMALGEGFVPATVGYQVPDPACDLDIVPNQGRRAEIKIALSNSLGFGGHNAAIALKKWEG